jgi:hypothetical protein
LHLLHDCLLHNESIHGRSYHGRRVIASISLDASKNSLDASKNSVDASKNSRASSLQDGRRSSARDEMKDDDSNATIGLEVWAENNAKE